MPKSSNKTFKTLHRVLLTTFIILSTIAAATPVLAATNIIEFDTGAAAIISTFAILMLAIIIEVWRFTNRHELPGGSHPIKK